MLPYHLDRVLKCTIVLILFLLICTSYAYYANSKRLDGDPQKRDYHPLAIILAIITSPFVLVLSISFYFLRVITYGVFLLLFILALIFFRKPFILVWLRKVANSIGSILLEANMIVVRFFLKPLVDKRDRI
jgi:hypothetical protein